MRKRSLLCLVAAVTLAIPSWGMSQQAIRWEPTLEGAQRLAGQTNRLVLIHFTAPWCQHCKWMEAQVFTQPAVAAALNADYVPVKINADNFPVTAKKYGVTMLPTTIIALPDGRPLKRVAERMDAGQYVALLNGVAIAQKQRHAPVYAQIPGGQPASLSQPASQPVGRTPASPTQAVAAGQTESRYPAQPQLPSQPRYGYPPATNPAGYGQSSAAPPVMGQTPVAVPVGPVYGAASVPPLPEPRRDQPAGLANIAPAAPAAGPANNAPNGQPTNRPGPNSSLPPAMNPPLGLDGYCPVSLCEQQKWVLGDRRWGAIHRGRTYLFAGPEEQRHFFADPDRYAPAVSGNDIVLATEQGQAVPGSRRHGVVFENRIYLFSSEASLERFARNPKAYASQALEALRSGAYPGRGELR